MDPRQADYLPYVDRVFSTASDGHPVERSTPMGVVLLTQCCDLARGGSGDPIAAAVVELPEKASSTARSGRQPRFASLSWLGSNLFADFSVSGSVQYETVVASERRSAPSTADRTFFASRVSRRFSRFAYPDDIQPFLRRLQERIRSKASSEASPLGICLQRVVTIRVENEAGWDAPTPWDVTITFVVREGELPTPGVESVEVPFEGSSAQIAERISALPAGSAGLETLWQALVQRLIDECLRTDESAVVKGSVGEVLEEGEYSFMRFRRSADLDIDDLSE